jgi:hypothetical protein
MLKDKIKKKHRLYIKNHYSEYYFIRSTKKPLCLLVCLLFFLTQLILWPSKKYFNDDYSWNIIKSDNGKLFYSRCGSNEDDLNIFYTWTNQNNFNIYIIASNFLCCS